MDNFYNFNTFSALAGIGYEFEKSAAEEIGDRPPILDGHKEKNEITVFGGQTIVNSLKSQKSVALAVEYRKRMWSYLDWTGTWLYEGDTRLHRRNGFASELWAVRDFLNDRLSFGFGGGAYFPIDERGKLKQSDTSRIICGIITMTSSYQFIPPWDVRVSWDRVITDYNHDTDVILGGVGYRF